MTNIFRNPKNLYMKKIFKVIVTAASLSAVSSNVLSAENKSNENSFNFDIFSLSKKKESAFDAPSATYILAAEDIRRAGITSIPEALRLVPGVQVSKIDGNKWAISMRGFDNQFSNKLLVLIDGRTVYTPLFSGVFWDIHDYVIEDIEKIEVVRGPGGTIWGANAVNGVINIITKNAAQTQGTYVSQVVGDQDKSITEARYGGKTSAGDSYRLYGKKSIKDGEYSSTNGKSKNDGYSQQRAGFRYDISSIKDSSISIHGDVFSGTARNYFSTLNNPNINNKDSRGANLVINWDKKLSSKSNFTLNAYYDYDQFHLPVLQKSANTYDIDFQHFYNFSKKNQFAWGLGYRRILDDIQTSTLFNSGGDPYIPINYIPNKRNDYISSIFLQDKIGIVADKLYLTLGAKILSNNYTGREYQPNAKLAYYPTRNQTLWASVSRAVRTPTRAEISFDIRVPDLDGGTGSLGNRNLKAENVISYEAGYRIKPTVKTLIDFTAFVNKYDDLVTYEGDVGNAANLGYGETYGAELMGKWQVTNDWKLEASYDFLKMALHVKPGSTDATTSISATTDALQFAEGRSPNNQFRLRSYYNITPKIEFDNMLYYMDSLPLAKPVNTDRKGVASYVRFDTRIGYLPKQNLDLSFGIRNLFDDRHQEYQGALFNTNTDIGRTFYFKAVWQY